jgi:hypothetical protein
MQVVIENGMNTKFDAADKDVAIRDSNLFMSQRKCNEVQNECVKYIIELMRKQVVTGDDTSSNVNAANSDATVAFSSYSACD